MTARHARHACCTAALYGLQAAKRRTRADSYRWRIVGTTLEPIYCPWCGIHLEANRIAIARQVERAEQDG